MTKSINARVKLCLAAIATATGAAGTAPAHAATTVLTFDPPAACAPAACGGRVPISQLYGDQAGVNLSYSVADGFGGTPSPHGGYIAYTESYKTAGDRGATGDFRTSNDVAQIRFDVTPGSTLTLNSLFAATTFNGTLNNVEFRIYDLGFNQLSTQTTNLPQFGGNMLTFGNSSTTGLILQFSNFGSFAIDNLSFSVDAAASGAVPEPATWAMMIGGFGAVGGVMRRVRRRAPALAV